MTRENCILCNKDGVENIHTLIIALQRKEKINATAYRESKEIPVPVCSKCLAKMKQRDTRNGVIGGITFLLFVIGAIVFFIWGIFHSPNEKSPLGTPLFVLFILILVIGICILLLVERKSLPRKIKKYTLITILKKEGWRVVPYFPIKSIE